MLAGVLVCGGPSAAQTLPVTLQTPPRDFGVFVGDLLTSVATITVPPGARLDERSLPVEGPVSSVIDVRRATVGGTPSRVEIRVTYQSFFSPEEVLGADVPGYVVAFVQGGRRLRASVPGFGFTASPFRHDLQPVLDPAALRADHVPAPARARGAAWEAAAGMAAMLCGLLVLAWPRLFAARQTPFAKAGREIARLARAPGGDAGAEAMRVLHRAFDATAGRRVLADDLDAFFDQHPRFAPLRERIGGFFASSRAVFFGAAAEAPGAAAWTALCRDLAGAERPA